MLVEKRNGSLVSLDVDEIKKRLVELSGHGLSGHSNMKHTPLIGIDCDRVLLETINNIYNKISTQKLDAIAASVAYGMQLEHPDYATLASRIVISNMHKITPTKFSDACEQIAAVTDRFHPEPLEFIRANAEALNAMIDDSADYLYSYFGASILERSYLIKDLRTAPMQESETAHEPPTSRILERPQHLLMRVAVQIYYGMFGPGPEITPNKLSIILTNIRECYELMSQQYFTHATPTLYNSCLKNHQMLSCFLLGTDDSIEAITKTQRDASLISKGSGGIGFYQHVIRSENQLIKGTGGRSSGLKNQLKGYDIASVTWNQGGGNRPGAFAAVLEIWHADIFTYLQLKLPNGKHENRAPSLHYALWIPDLFFERVEQEGFWTLFSEDTAPGLSDVYDEGTGNDSNRKFKALYEQYEREGRGIRKVPATLILAAIYDAIIETGEPYICAKDVANRKSNHKNRGTLKTTNLCAEIYEYCSPQEYACCTLASLNLKRFLRTNSQGKLYFDFKMLARAVNRMVRNLDRIIDCNKYPVSECKLSNDNMRPIAIGVQGLANLFMELRVPFQSIEAEQLDAKIFETIYYAALTATCELADELGPYKYFAGSPISQGKIAPDCWERQSMGQFGVFRLDSGSHDWAALRARASKGVRNSLLTALMPTVSTSQILGNEESFEPQEKNIYNKSTSSGVFNVVNHLLVKHLIELGLWTPRIRAAVETARGSVKAIPEIPAEIAKIYECVNEISHKYIMERMARRHPFVDQGASLNTRLTDPTFAKFIGVILHGWKLGLKTISYYTRTSSAATARGTVALNAYTHGVNGLTQPADGPVCTRAADCDACSG